MTGLGLDCATCGLMTVPGRRTGFGHCVEHEVQAAGCLAAATRSAGSVLALTAGSFLVQRMSSGVTGRKECRPLH